ncbi:putative membrane protein [Microbacterium esteraromaticum]|uniref:Putative membrane protein n=1 Tax=Microbacterium esteraromaticum TaxID=57043 RepID=A0A1R4JXS6_9MICO|nr:putative membrane protein [Microbacterium esteraromaticum]
MAHELDGGSHQEHRTRNAAERQYSRIPRKSRIIFLEVHTIDSSEFEEDLRVEGEDKFGYRV